MNNNINTIQNFPLNINPDLYSNYTEDITPMSSEEEAKFMENIDMEEIDRVIDYLETQEDNPDMWIPFDEAMDDIRRTILNE